MSVSGETVSPAAIQAFIAEEARLTIGASQMTGEGLLRMVDHEPLGHVDDIGGTVHLETEGGASYYEPVPLTKYKQEPNCAVALTRVDERTKVTDLSTGGILDNYADTFIGLTVLNTAVEPPVEVASFERPTVRLDFPSDKVLVGESVEPGGFATFSVDTKAELDAATTEQATYGTWLGALAAEVGYSMPASLDLL